MAFLLVNHIPFPVADGTFREENREVGSDALAYSGTSRRSRRALKRDCFFESSPMSGAEAKVWSQLLLGEGQSWSFDASLYSSKGLGPSASASTPTIEATNKYGGGSLYLGGASSDSVTYTLSSNASGAGTIYYWARRSAVWAVYAQDTSGRKWVGGARNDGASTPWVATFNATTLTLTADASDTHVDELHWWPFLVADTTWFEGYGPGSVDRVLGRSPTVELAGDVVEELPAYRYALCTVRAEVLQGVYGGAWNTDLRRLVVEAREF